jgi:hypothetical protein
MPTTSYPSPSPAAQTATDRPARYEAKCEQALALMQPHERLPELRAERLRWIARYEQFVADLDRGCPAPWGAHVNDYILVIAYLGKKIAEEERHAG